MFFHTRPREHGGVQALWNKGSVPTFGQRWNPWCSDIPWITFAHHPMFYHDKEKEKDKERYNVDDFVSVFSDTVEESYKTKNPGATLNVQEGPVEIQTYASVTSLVFNQSHIGFCMDRGGVSF